MYEITVKSFGEQRVKEAYESLVAVSAKGGLLIPTITVLCRAEDVHPDAAREIDSSAFLGEYEHQSLRFFFLDLFEWITIGLFRMSLAGRTLFYQKINDYITDHNTAISVKKHWNKLIAEINLPNTGTEQKTEGENGSK